jgi:cobalamin biosynthesis Mg chelatase CobN
MSNKPTALSLANEIAAILGCTNQERIKASKEIIASLWNYTRQEESTAFFLGMIMRVMLPEKDSQCLHTLGQLIELAEQRHEELLEVFRQERESMIEAIRARNRPPHPAITACTMVYAGDDCGDW